MDSISISKYLTLPPKRPEYRKDRPHSDFLCSLGHHVAQVPTHLSQVPIHTSQSYIHTSQTHPSSYVSEKDNNDAFMNMMMNNMHHHHAHHQQHQHQRDIHTSSNQPTTHANPILTKASGSADIVYSAVGLPPPPPHTNTSPSTSYSSSSLINMEGSDIAFYDALIESLSAWFIPLEVTFDHDVVKGPLLKKNINFVSSVVDL